MRYITLQSIITLPTAALCSISTPVAQHEISSSKKILQESVLKYRGGGFLGLFNDPSQKATKLHIQNLEAQIEALQLQVRTAREEARQFRMLLNSSKGARRAASLKLVRDLEHKCTDLMKQISEMLSDKSRAVSSEENLKEELSILKAAVEKVQALADEKDDLIAKLRKEGEAFKKLSEQKMKDLEGASSAKVRELEKASAKQLQEERRRMKSEAEDEKKQIQMEAEEDRKRLRAEADERVKDAQRILQLEADKLVNAEKVKRDNAVEAEKAKMRKLVKALGEREKREQTRSEAPQRATTNANSLRNNKSNNRKGNVGTTPVFRSP